MFEIKELAYFIFFVIAMYFSNRSSYEDGKRKGIEIGVEGTIDSLIADGFLEVDEEGEISPKKT